MAVPLGDTRPPLDHGAAVGAAVSKGCRSLFLAGQVSAPPEVSTAPPIEFLKVAPTLQTLPSPHATNGVKQDPAVFGIFELSGQGH